MSEASTSDAQDVESASFDELWRAIQAGQSVEYRQLVEDCTPYLLKVVRRRLDRRLRRRFDSIDFTQAVWVSFVAKLDQLPTIANAYELRGYLAQMASNKVSDEVRRQYDAQKRDVTRERTNHTSDLMKSVSERQPTPSQFAMANERLERLMAGRSHEHQRIIQLRFEGEEVPNIAVAVGLSQRQVRRVLCALELEYGGGDDNAGRQP
jgi:RNA polymerase sigma factor (sigma-70 family)